MQALEGPLPPQSTVGLKPSLKEQGYFLACICQPEHDLDIALPGTTALPITNMELIKKSDLNSDIYRVLLRPETPFEFRAGQFINLYREDGITRSYSLASLPGDNPLIELHIKRLPKGKMSNWIYDELQIGESIAADGPHGDCFYLKTEQRQNMLLVGTGTGLAPLWGIIHDALKHDHTGSIHLFQGGRQLDDLYLVDELQQLAREQSNFHYHPTLSGDETLKEGFSSGRANSVALQHFPKLDDWRVYLCGSPGMVNDSKKQAFLAGASLHDIYADPFTPPTNPR